MDDQGAQENQPEKLSWKKRLFGTEGLIGGVVVFILLFVVVMIFQSCTPKKGSILYGLCGTFLEQQVPFPMTLKHTSVEQYSKAIRIYFTHIDGFGGYQFEMTECTFRQDSKQGVQIDRVFFNYVKDVTDKERMAGKGRLYEVRQDVIDLFNKSQSPLSILSHDPDLTLPQDGMYRF
jgi:hypothetical protein